MLTFHFSSRLDIYWRLLNFIGLCILVLQTILKMTPSEKAGIIIEGENKWLTLKKTSLSHDRYEKSTT